MPGIFDQLKQLVKDRYAAGPPKGYPSAGPGSVLDQHNTQLQQLLPSQNILTPSQALPMKPPAPDPTAAYGTRPGEKRIDVTEYQKPLSGFSGVKTQ